MLCIIYPVLFLQLGGLIIYFILIYTLIIVCFNSSVFPANFSVSNTEELRAALSEASGNGTNDVITLGSGTYSTNTDGLGSFTFIDNEPFSLTLVGQGANSTILSGENTNPVFRHQSTTESPLIIHSLSIRDGFMQGDSVLKGAGLFTSESVSIFGCKFINNQIVATSSSTNIEGVAIYSSGKRVTISTSVFTENKTPTNAGVVRAILNVNPDSSIDALLSINSSQFNTNTLNANTIHSGTIFSRIRTIIDNSEFSFNAVTASSCNGLVRLDVGTSIIRKSEFKDNYADCEFTNFSPLLMLTGRDMIIDSIISNNILKTEPTSGPIISQTAGGLALRSSFSVALIDSIVSSNKITGTTIFPNIVATISSAQRNVTIINSYIGENTTGDIYFRETSGSRAYNSYFASNSPFAFKSFDSNSIIDLQNNFVKPSNILVTSVGSNNFFTTNKDFLFQNSIPSKLTTDSSLINAGSRSLRMGNLEETVLEFNNYDVLGNPRIRGSNVDIGPIESELSAPTIGEISIEGSLKVGQTLTLNTLAVPELGRTIVKFEISFNNAQFKTTSIPLSYLLTAPGELNILIRATDSSGEFSETNKVLQIEDLSLDEKLSAAAVKAASFDKSILNSNQIGWKLVGTRSGVGDLSIFDQAEIVWSFQNDEWKFYTTSTEKFDVLTSTGKSFLTTIEPNSGIWIKFPSDE